jgi:pilus assembly protein CpaB
MRKKSFIIALAGAVIFGLIATVSVSRYLSNVQAYTKTVGNVVVAKVPIALGEKITAEKLEMVPMPNGSVPEGAFDSVEKVVGRVAVLPLFVREPVTSTKLAAEGAAGGLQAVIPEGFRAMTVGVNEVVGVSGFILPGSFVDIVCVITPQDGAQGPISKIVLQNIKVLANGQNLDQPKDGREAAQNIRAVTLQVTPEQAEKLALASGEGRLQLVLRNFGDQEDARTQGANKRSLLTDITAPIIPEPDKSPAAQAAVPRPAFRPRRRVVLPQEEPAATPPAARPLAAPRLSVEVIEGAKKRNVDVLPPDLP